MSSADRTVHGLSMSRNWEVVRYERAWKWYLERTDGGSRVRVGVNHAARVAANGNFYPGLPGGKAFDAKVRQMRASVGDGA